MRKVYDDKNLNISQGEFPKPYAPGVDLDFNCWQYNDNESDEFIDEF
jgi:hypothetical protein